MAKETTPPKNQLPAPEEMVAISAALPLSRLDAAVSRLLSVADSAVLTITGDANRIASAAVGLGSKFNVKSARLSLRGGPAK